MQIVEEFSAWQCLSVNKRNCIILTELGQKNYDNTKWGRGQSVNSTKVHLSLMPRLYIFISTLWLGVAGLKTFSVDAVSFRDWFDGGGSENCLETGWRCHMKQLVIVHRPSYLQNGLHPVPQPYGDSPASQPSGPVFSLCQLKGSEW